MNNIQEHVILEITRNDLKLGNFDEVVKQIHPAKTKASSDAGNILAEMVFEILKKLNKGE